MNASDELEIVHRQLAVDDPEPATQVAQHVADISGRDVATLDSTWETFDHMVDEIFSNPPSPDAQVEVTFTYEGYRITIDQGGNARFVPVGASVEADDAANDD